MCVFDCILVGCERICFFCNAAQYVCVFMWYLCAYVFVCAYEGLSSSCTGLNVPRDFP